MNIIKKILNIKPKVKLSFYKEIFNFCKVRNVGSVYKNTNEVTPRVNFILQLLDREKIAYEIDKFQKRDIWCYNIILRGDSDKMVIAHHDIVNPDIDNANDNSASIINAIAVKKHLPNIHVVLTDGEEMGGIGSQRLSDKINEGDFGSIKWVLNLELTGKGGKHFFIGDGGGEISKHILSLFDCPIVKTPYNDSITIRDNGIDSVVINPLPPLKKGVSSVKWKEGVYLDNTLLYNCHSERDTLDTISVTDMKEFVEKVLIKILK